jgi:hypothetical protein
MGDTIEHLADKAVAEGNWTVALAAFEHLATLHPDNAAVLSARGHAELQCRLHEIEGADAVASSTPFTIPTGATTADRADRALMLRFESLGLDCEFGLVQRHYGAEPLGLFRWNGIMPEPLCDALEHDFVGIGDPATTTLSYSDALQEYLLHEPRYGMGMHSFIRTRDPAVPDARLHAQLCRRAAFLRDKLLSDLAGAEKLLLYQFPSRLNPDLRARLVAALRRHNQANRLLLVHEAAADERPGTVSMASDGVLEGAIDHLCGRRGGWETLSTAVWRTICRNAVALLSFGNDAAA